MKPVVSSISVPSARDDVFAFLDELANHEQFTDHFLVDWACSGPPAGVGARAQLRAKARRSDVMRMEVVAAERPRSSVEETVSAGGRRRTRGTYVLDSPPGGGTQISFKLEWLQATASDRVLAPLTRGYVRRGNDRAMRRLAERLCERHADPAQPPAAPSR